jgi:hypothetical protein
LAFGFAAIAEGLRELRYGDTVASLKKWFCLSFGGLSYVSIVDFVRLLTS